MVLRKLFDGVTIRSNPNMSKLGDSPQASGLKLKNNSA